jgi:uncharacterized protein with HEPN domain
MPDRDWTFRVTDILNAINNVQNYTAGMECDQFISDRRTVDAVIRNFIIIGEAATHIPDEVCRNHADIPWKDMRAMRNFVVHEYFGISDRIIWETVQKDLPPIIPLLQNLLNIET